MNLELHGPAGRLEALIDLPAGAPRAAAVFAHPHPQYGGTMHTKVVFRAAKALDGLGCAVLRFNFRGVGRSEGTFDAGAGEREDFDAALRFMRDRHPGLDLWAGGFSFGCWIALSAGAADEAVAALIGIGVPVGSYDLSFLERCRKPKFLIHGERDELFPVRTVRALYGRLPEPKELVVIDGADHLFDGKTGEVGDAIQDLLDDFPERPGARRLE